MNVRQALPKERALWQRTRNFATQLDPTKEEIGTLEIWLVSITNRSDNDARRRPLH